MSIRKALHAVSSLGLLGVFMIGAALAAQEPPSKVDVFTGYAWLYPGGRLLGARIPNIPTGAAVAPTYFFNRNFGLGLDAGAHFCCNPNIYTLQAGPVVRWPGEHVTPFIHAMVGAHKMNFSGIGSDIGLGVLAGGGLDVALFHRLSLRLFEADYQYARNDYDPGLRTTLNGARLSTGLVWRFGSVENLGPSASADCSAQPNEIAAGELVTATAMGSNFDSRRPLTYRWTGTGVYVAGNGSSTDIDTNGLQPGTYQVQANLRDGSKHGVANCHTAFVVKEPNAPVIACAAYPGTVQTGGSSRIQSTATSPDHRQLTYSYSSSAGSISGNDVNALLDTASATPGVITVTCYVSDDHSPALSASSTTEVTLEPPLPPPPAPLRSSRLNEISFPNQQKPARVDNTAKAILDDVALRLQRDPDSTAVLVGESDNLERNSRTLAAQRSLNTKAYLVTEKGIDASRIQTRSGNAGGRTTQIWLVPDGATFNSQGTDLVRPRPIRAQRADR